MIANNLKITWRNLIKNKFSSFVNVGGLSVGMAVAMLIGLWIWDELSFNKYHSNYDRIANVMEQGTYNGTVNTGGVIPLPLEAEMRLSYGNDFKHIVMSTIPWNHILSVGDKRISYTGAYIGNEAPEMFTLKMIAGNRSGLSSPSSMLISQSVGKALFGDADPIGQLIKIDNNPSFKVSGVYEDLPRNSSLHEVTFMAPWEYFRTSQDWLVNRAAYDWNDNFLLMYVQLADGTDMLKVSEKIKYVKRTRVSNDQAQFNPLIILHPMSKWHLYSRFTNGINTGGAIEYVWLFGIIGIFVLILACINFMNLSTARSEKRAKDTGIRKAIGSRRSQLMSQFFCESLFVALLAFSISMVMVELALPVFNEVAYKQMHILWSNPLFWLAGIGFTLFTGLLAGSYPALYLSSFQPVDVLKGTFKAGRLASAPRQVLVVLQFTVSVVLIIGTLIIVEQIQFAKNRPVGYSREGLVNIEITVPDLHNHFATVRAELMKSGVIVEAAESSSPATGVNNNRNDVDWKGKDPAITSSFAYVRVTTEYGKTVGWQFLKGRDFSTEFRTDSTAVILNEAAVKYMGLRNPLGETIRVGRRDLNVIGIIKDMVMESPYEPVKQAIFNITRDDYGYLNIRINPGRSAHEALSKIDAVCKTYSPSEPLSYKFADDEYAKKFADEERIGKLTGFFALLAISISCIGLFGMASFMAEQRVKEIGVRKVMGASVFGLWRLLSRDFVILVIISLLIAMPIAYSFMNGWLQHYKYHTELSWWIFAVTAVGAIVITLLTVSYQSITAALANPVKSLRQE